MPDVKNHRASWLQAFHSGISESQRKANIEATASDSDTMEIITVSPDETGTRSKPAGQRCGTGVVRTISKKQVDFILKLLMIKDLSTLNILPGQTIDPSLVHTMGIKGGSALIEKLLALPAKPIHSVTILNQGSSKQIAFLKSLMQDTNTTESDVNRNYSSISEAISALILVKKNMPKEDSVTITNGVYSNGTTIIRAYKARQSDRILSKELKGNKEDGYYYEYLGMAERFITKDFKRMSMEEAKQFGKLTGTCCVCGIELTDPDSQNKGIGPYCEKNF